MEYTGYLDFWFTDRPIVERVEPMVKLGIHRVDAWYWRGQPMAELAAECRRLGALSTLPSTTRWGPWSTRGTTI